MFGGGGPTDSSDPLGDTWEWDGTNWTSLPVNGPSPRLFVSMAYDATRNVTVLFGGSYDNIYYGDTWTWDGTTWAQASPAKSPSARSGSPMAFDTVRQVGVLFAGNYFGPGVDANVDDTWEWDGTTWTQRIPATSPSARGWHGLAYDPTRGATLLFGGNVAANNSVLSDTWEWDGTNWTQQSPSSNPGSRCQESMVYTPGNGSVLLFGGFSQQGEFLNDTWEWQ